MKVPEGSKYFVRCFWCLEPAFYLTRDVAATREIMKAEDFTHPDGSHPDNGTLIRCPLCGEPPFWDNAGRWVAKLQPISELEVDKDV